MNLRSLSAVLAMLIFLGYGFLKGIDIGQLLNLQSLMIVFGGICLVLWFGFSQDEIKRSWVSIRNIFKGKDQLADENELLSDVLRLARVYRMHGPVALEKAIANVKDDFLRFGVILVAEGYERMDLYTALEREHRVRCAIDLGPIRMFRTLARLSPALGMAGTVISLMKVMQDLGQVDFIGNSLGLALSSTLYGILLANLFFLPIMLKIERLAEKRAAMRIMLTEAVMALHKGEHPLRIAERLNSFDLYCRINGKKAPCHVSGKKAVLKQIAAG